MVDTWNVRKTMDSSGTDVNSINKLDDTFVGETIGMLLDGIRTTP